MAWPIFTYLGDSMLLLPSALVLAIALYFKTTQFRSAIIWLVAFGCSGLLVSLSKILFLGFFIGSAHYNFTGISGHTAMSTTFWPVVFWFVARGLPVTARLWLVVAGYLLALGIAYSRLVLHAHSLSEVITGLMVGGLSSLSCLLLLWQRPYVPLRPVEGLMLICLPIVIFSTGKPATTQRFLGQLAAAMAGIEKPHTRQQLLAKKPHNHPHVLGGVEKPHSRPPIMAKEAIKN